VAGAHGRAPSTPGAHSVKKCGRGKGTGA
jgi:hypothetical protein